MLRQVASRHRPSTNSLTGLKFRREPLHVINTQAATLPRGFPSTPNEHIRRYPRSAGSSQNKVAFRDPMNTLLESLQPVIELMVTRASIVEANQVERIDHVSACGIR